MTWSPLSMARCGSGNHWALLQWARRIPGTGFTGSGNSECSHSCIELPNLSGSLNTVLDMAPQKPTPKTQRTCKQQKQTKHQANYQTPDVLHVCFVDSTIFRKVSWIIACEIVQEIIYLPCMLLECSKSLDLLGVIPDPRDRSESWTPKTLNTHN